MRRNRIDHVQAAAALRAAPGEWLPVGEYNSGQSATHMGWFVRTGSPTRGATSSPYAPAGAFEAKTELTEFGALLLARFVGVQGGA